MQGGVTYNGSTLLSGGIDVNTGGNIEPLTLTYNANGNYVVNAPEGVDGYDPININVNVPQVEPVLDTLIVSQNGQYRPPEGVAGYDLVDVNVITPPPVLDTLNVSQNGQYTPPEGVAGYNQVNVAVPAPVLTSKSITENGTYTPPSGVDGYNEVVVNVPSETGLIRPNLYKEYLDSAMVSSNTFDKTIINWQQPSTAIGCSLNGNVNLANNNLSTLSYDITTGVSYDSVNGQNIRPLIIGVTNQIRTSPIYVSQSNVSSYFTRYKMYDVNDINKNIIDSIDLTGITGDFYLFIVATGWNFTINKLQLT